MQAVRSRIRMPMRSTLAKRMIGDTYLAKQFLQRQWRDGEAGDILFRLDGEGSELVITVQSGKAPNNWDGSAFPLGTSLTTGVVNVTPKAGDEFRFRLRANCVWKKGRHEPVELAETEEQQREWMRLRGEKHGFEVVSLNIVPEGLYFGTQSKSRRRITTFSVGFSGVLKVTDAERFSKALADGVGRQKRFGFALLDTAVA